MSNFKKRMEAANRKNDALKDVLAVQDNRHSDYTMPAVVKEPDEAKPSPDKLTEDKNIPSYDINSEINSEVNSAANSAANSVANSEADPGKESAPEISHEEDNSSQEGIGAVRGETASENNAVIEEKTAEPVKKKPAQKSVNNTVKQAAANIAEFEAVPKKDLVRKALMLTHENNRFMRMRSKQLGLTMDSYMNLLVKEEQQRAGDEDREDRSFRIYEAAMGRFKGSKERSTIGFSEENADFLVEDTSNAGVSLTDYMNMLLKDEAEREDRNGKRYL